MQILFIHLTSNPQEVNIQIPQFHKISLLEYSIKGAPVTASVPDELYYSLFSNPDLGLDSNLWIRNDNHSRAAVSLPLSGSFTHQQLQVPVVVWERGQKFNRVSRFSMELRTPNGELAVFDECVLKFLIQ